MTKEKLLSLKQQKKTDNAASLKRINSLNTLLASSNQQIDQLKLQLPKIIKKVPCARGGLEWEDEITQLCMEMHTHRNPPKSTAANITSVCALISPNQNLIEDVISSSLICETRGALVVETLTLAAKQIASASKILASHGNWTQRRGITFEKNVLRLLEEAGYKNVCLNSSIICKDGTGESMCVGTVRAFFDGSKLLAGWRRLAKRMFPKDDSLEEEIPHPRKFHLGRLAQDKPWLIDDGCPALRYGLIPEQIKTYV